ncbi:MAG: hypothetical protein QME12_02455 [Nanoarchaeota archaeon]|nr:hypothetical protein [Nanoarchaeota archaeon]
MLKKGILLTAVLAILLLSVFISAEDAQPVLPEGVKQIQGDKGVTEYNAEEITALFGAAPVEDNGALKIKYKDSRNRIKDFGTVTGKIEAVSEKTIGITKIAQPRSSMANYISPETSGQAVDVKGVKFAINATNRAEGRFGFILVADTAFQIDESRERDIDAEEKAIACKGSCRIWAEMSSSEISFKVGNGTLLFKKDVTNFMRGEAMSMPSVNLLKLSSVKILPVREGDEEPVLAVTAFSDLRDFENAFGTISFISSQEVELRHGRLYDIGRNRYVGTESIDTIIAKEANVLAKSNIDIRLNHESGGFIEVSLPTDRGNSRLFGLKQGKMVINSVEANYHICNQIADTGCAFISGSSSTIKIKPLYLNLEIFDPASIGFTSLYFERFLTNDLVVVSKAGKEFVFGNNRVDINPTGDWFEFGLSFDTYPITYKDEATGDVTEYRFRCDVNTKKCFFVTPPSGPEQEVISFTERKPIQCRADADCGVGKTCAEYRCRTPVTCDKLIDGGPVDILFVSEGYTDYTAFKNDVRYMLGSASARGLFTVSPFSDIKGRFTVWTALGATSRLPLDAPGVSRNYLRDYEAQCNNDIAIVLSAKQDLRAHASRVGTIAVTMQDVAITLAHEMGHAYADLKDEYLSPKSPNVPNLLSTGSSTFASTGPPNCLDERSAISQWGSARWAGCGGDCNQDTDECGRLQHYYRPNENSIMKDHTVPGVQFNEPSKQAILNVGRLGPSLSIEQLSDMIRNNQGNI